jgi:hypothetical protein
MGPGIELGAKHREQLLTFAKNLGRPYLPSWCFAHTSVVEIHMSFSGLDDEQASILPSPRAIRTRAGSRSVTFRILSKSLWTPSKQLGTSLRRPVVNKSSRAASC